ncbi:unnamed protein product [Rotaria magnacalcarata]|nr:unnamed protein product [Rotaria magnacalcarata]
MPPSDQGSILTYANANTRIMGDSSRSTCASFRVSNLKSDSLVFSIGSAEQSDKNGYTGVGCNKQFALLIENHVNVGVLGACHRYDNRNFTVGPDTLNDGVFHQICITYNNVTSKLCVYRDSDDPKCVIRNNGPLNTGLGDVRIGWWADNTFQSVVAGNGLIRSVSLFDQEISQNYRGSPVKLSMTDSHDCQDQTTMGACLSAKSKLTIKNTQISNALSVYVPLESLTEKTVHSIISTATQAGTSDWNHSRRTLLTFLLAINDKLQQIEKNENANEQYNEYTIQHAKQVRRWLVRKHYSGKVIDIDWNDFRTHFEGMFQENDDEIAKRYRVKTPEPYYELGIRGLHPHIEQSRRYMNRFRKDGFKPEELKVYWNEEQLEDLCPKHEQCDNSERLPPHDPSDIDAIQYLRQYPVSQRNHAVEIRAQEEIILYNSDGYRALLDLKYGRMGGGYALPEFGLAYVRDICFVHPKTEHQRLADMMVSACYSLHSTQLYDNPRSEEEYMANTTAKFRAFMAAAVANTKGDGSNTYLLLGPIGTGAFGNDVRKIRNIFYQVLSSRMMGSTGPIRNAFKHIWFVSTDAWKNDLFKKILSCK